MYVDQFDDQSDNESQASYRKWRELITNDQLGRTAETHWGWNNMTDI